MTVQQAALRRPAVRPLTIALVTLALFLAVLAVGLPGSRIHFADTTLRFVLASALATGAAATVPWAIRLRLQNRRDPIAIWLIKASHAADTLIRYAALMFLLGVCTVLTSYLSVSLRLPLRDDVLASIDLAWGFDWRAFLDWTNRYPNLAMGLRIAYHSTGFQLVAVFAFLSWIGRKDRMAEFVALFGITSLATNILMTLVPAAGAYAYFNPQTWTFSNYSPISGMWHFETFTALREHLKPVFDFYAAQGIVTFPSFHTVLAVLTCYALRGWPSLLIPAIALNAVLLVGTVTEGGHHFIDLVAGAAVAEAAILLVRWLTRT